MELEKILHHGEYRILLKFPYDTSTKEKIKTIKGCTWSKTYRSWHIPYTREAFSEIKRMFPNLEYQEKSASSTDKPKEKEGDPEGSEPVLMQVFEKKILVKMEKNEADLRFIKELIRYSNWDWTNRLWQVTNFGTNLDKIRSYFGTRLKDAELMKEDEISSPAFDTDIRIVRTASGRLKIIGKYNKDLIKKIKEFPYWKYDKMNKCFSIPFSELFLRQLQNIITALGKSFSCIEDVKGGPVKKRKRRDEIENFRPCPDTYIFKLKELRYSKNTCRNYTSMFTEFINFFDTVEIDKITEDEIRSFLMYLNVERNVSESTLNLAINAIKFYYEKVKGGERKFYFIDRPKLGKTLPKFLNTDEIKKMIEVTRNIKHKTLIIILYATGMRLAEVLDCKLDHFDWERRQLLIMGKGRKERYVPIPAKFDPFYEKYMERYKPSVYLFEGMNGGKYSRGSVEKVVKRAAVRAGVDKDITPHKVRHTFATHDYELTKDIRALQEKLGHSSIKTTEIYTHVTSRKNTDEKNPFDELDIG